MNQPMKPTFAQWSRRYLLNLNLIAVVAVLVYILFFTENSIQATYHYEQEAAALQEAVKIEQDSLEYYRQLNTQLSSDPYALEQVARERYHMQRPHEDIFIIK